MKTVSFNTTRILVALFAWMTLTPSTAWGQTGSQTVVVKNEMTLVPVIDGIVSLSPQNSKVEFVGTHVGDRPDPRLGGFEKFTGSIMVEGSLVTGVTAEFEISSIWTQIPNLTAHLKTADFFDSAKFPTASFQSTSVKTIKDKTVVTGNLTMLGQTAEISFPISIVKTDEGFGLNSQFKLDRTNWGMSKMTKRVNAEVSLKVVVGQSTQPVTGRGARGFDIDGFFNSADKNGDGKLTGDEIPKRLKTRVGQMDANADGAISLEEFKVGMGSREGDR